MKKIALLTMLILCGVSAGLAQKTMYEPKKGSTERQALADAIRTYDAGRNAGLKGSIFAMNALKVQGNWAFASVERTNLPDAVQGSHLVFLHKSGAAWTVMWSDFNDNQEVGVEALKRLRKKHKDFYRQLAEYAENGYLAG